MIAANNLPIGCVILFLHDIADIPVSLLKFSTCFKTSVSWLVDPLIFVGLIVSWGWTRIGVLTYFCHLILKLEIENPEYKSYTIVY